MATTEVVVKFFTPARRRLAVLQQQSGERGMVRYLA